MPRHRTYRGLVFGGARLAVYVVLGLALARMAVALDENPSLVRQAWINGLQTLGFRLPGAAPPVVPAASSELQPRPRPDPRPRPEQAEPADGTGDTNRITLHLWEYRLPELGRAPGRWASLLPPGGQVPGDQARVVEAATSEFRERYPQVEVAVTWLSENEITAELSSAAAQGKPLPDLVALPRGRLISERATAITTLRGGWFGPVENAICLPEWALADLPAASGAGPWLIPRWMEWQGWLVSPRLWQQAGLPLDEVRTSGWSRKQALAWARKARAAAAGSSPDRPATLFLFPTASAWEGLLLAGGHPRPYEPSARGPQVAWPEEVLQDILGSWRDWLQAAGPRPFSSNALSDWTARAAQGKLFAAGPAGPLVYRLLQPAANRTDQDEAPALVPVPGDARPGYPAFVSGYQVLSHRTPSEKEQEAAESERVRLSTELGLLLASRTGQWAQREWGFLPVAPGARASPSPVAGEGADSHRAGLAPFLQPQGAIVRNLLPFRLAEAVDAMLRELERYAPDLARGNLSPGEVAQRAEILLLSPLKP